jgi:hypothetical protein
VVWPVGYGKAIPARWSSVRVARKDFTGATTAAVVPASDDPT